MSDSDPTSSDPAGSGSEPGAVPGEEEAAEDTPWYKNPVVIAIIPRFDPCTNLFGDILRERAEMGVKGDHQDDGPERAWIVAQTGENR